MNTQKLLKLTSALIDSAIININTLLLDHESDLTNNDKADLIKAKELLINVDFILPNKL